MPGRKELTVMEKTLQEQITEAIIRGDYKYAQMLRDELEAKQKAEKLQETRATLEKFFDARDFIKTVNPDEFQRYIWEKVKNHETLTPMDRLKLATIQAYQTDMKKIERVLNENIDTIVQGGAA
jgi:hypothetical protein